MKYKNTYEETFNMILLISLLNLLIYILTLSFTSYGIFRDELYYLACANHLDFGYVDHPPLSIWILAAWKFVLGDSVFMIRLIPAFVSSAAVFLIGLFTVRLGGGKSAVIISMLTFMLSPIFLGMTTIYSMNVFDFFFWILSAYIFLMITETENRKLWITLGIIIGLGLLNKTSMLWLSGGIFVGTVLTPAREDLKTKYPYIAAGIALLIFSPYVIWNLVHDFAHLEFIRNAAEQKYGGLTPVSFVLDMLLIFNPVSILIWLPGVIFFFFTKNVKQFRAIGYIWLVTLAVLFINWHSKAEYIAPAFQLLFAGGAVMIVKWNARKKRLKYALVLPVVVIGIFLLPLARPLLPAESFLTYQSALRLQPPSNERHQLDGLPQFYADMFGWEDMAKNVSKVYKSLSDIERKNVVVYCSNYGRAGAMEYYRKKHSLPKVISPHNSCWFWAPEINNYTTIIILGGRMEDHLEYLEEVYEAGFHKSKYSIPYENNLTIFVGKRLKKPFNEVWKEVKIFI